jgi:hypothetical protein
MFLSKNYKASEMDPSSTASITEFAVAIAGFSGLVLALGSREGKADPVVKFRTITMLLCAFTAAFGSLLPILGQSIGIEAVWHFSGYALVVLLLANMASTFLTASVLLTPLERKQLARWMWWLTMIGNSLFATILIVALADFSGISIEGAFIGALIWQLIFSSILFTRLIVRG